MQQITEHLRHLHSLIRLLYDGEFKTSNIMLISDFSTCIFLVTLENNMPY